MIMIHKAWGMVVGNSDDMRTEAAILEKIDGTLVQTYVARTGESDDAIAEMLRAETWLTSSEAVALGFADRISESAAQASIKWDLSAFHNAPAALHEQRPADPPPPANREPSYDLGALSRRLAIATRI